MYIYKIGYYSCEESEYTELQHYLKFSKKELDEMFVDTVMGILLRRRVECGIDWCEEGNIPDSDIKFYKQNAKEIFGKDEITIDDIHEKLKGTGYHYTTYQTIHDYTIRVMIEKYGFSRFKYDGEISVNGWGGIVNKSGSFRKDEPILDKIADRFWEIKK